MKIASISSLLILSSVLFVSCLKSRDETGLLGDKDKGTVITEITDVSYNNLYGQDQVVALAATPASQTVTAFTLKYQAGKNPPSSDIKVKITPNNSNLAAGTVPLPTANYTIPAEITIPRSNARTVAFPITINRTGLNPAMVYGLTFKITSVSEGVISELGKEITVYFTL